MINRCPNCRTLIANGVICPKCGVNIMDLKEELKIQPENKHELFSNNRDFNTTEQDNLKNKFFTPTNQEEKNQNESSDTYDDNMIAAILKTIGILIFIFGTVGSIFIAGGNESTFHFSFINFILPEFGIIVAGTIFLVFSEIINLLQDIKNKMK